MLGLAVPVGGAPKAVRIAARLAGVFILLSFFIPWWSGTIQAVFVSEPTLLAPAWSFFVLSDLGTKLTIHMRSLLALLLVAVSFLLAWRVLARRWPEVAARLLHVGTVVWGAGIVLFATVFPRVGYVGHVFWPWGQAIVTHPFGGDIFVQTGDILVQWTVWPGFGLALAAWGCLLVLVAYAPHPWTEARASPIGRPPSFRSRVAGRPSVRVFALSVTWMVLAAVLWGGVAVMPTVSPQALFNDFDVGFKSFEPGDHIVLAGTVTNVTVIETNYGKFTIIDLDNVAFPLALAGDQRERYALGSRVAIPVDFRAYEYNDFHFTGADPGFAPMAMMFFMDQVLQDVSAVMGFALEPVRGFESRLEVHAAHGFPLDAFRAALIDVNGPPFAGETASGGDWPLFSPPVDGMIPLREGTSDNGTFSFEDANGNGLLDWGDTFDLHLPPTADETHIDSYLLRLYGPMDGMAYVPVRERGPLLFFVTDWEFARPALFLTMPDDVVSGDRCASRVEIARSFPSAAMASESTLGVVTEEGRSSGPIPAETLNATLVGGGNVRFEDQGTANVLDAGDAWAFSDLDRNATYELTVNGVGGLTFGRIKWACGLGVNIANWPRLAWNLVPEPPRSFLLNIASVEWVPAGKLESYGVVLRKNGTALLPSSGEPESLACPFGGSSGLPLGPSSDGAGTMLEFADVDGNGYLGPGDEFRVLNTAAQSDYALELYRSDLYPFVMISWTT